MKLAVTGGRDYTNEAFVWVSLDEIHLKTPITCLVHGAARGVDTFADRWAISRRVRRVPYPVSKIEWKKYGKSAGHRRNRRMLEAEKPDILVAFPGQNGTANCRENALDLRIPLYVYSFGIKTVELRP